MGAATACAAWLAFSIAIHALILALIIFGLPYFHPKREDMPPMISVELVEMGKETTTNKISDANKVVQKPEEEQPAPPTQPPPGFQADPATARTPADSAAAEAGTSACAKNSRRRYDGSGTDDSGLHGC